MDKKDSILEIKEFSALLSLSLRMLKEKIVKLVCCDQWILEDINLFENYAKLKEMTDISHEDLEIFVARMQTLDKEKCFFSIIDMLDELGYINDNIALETEYLGNMYYYMCIVVDYDINSDKITEVHNKYFEIDNILYNQMRINNEGLKKLRKERRDYLE